MPVARHRPGRAQAEDPVRGRLFRGFGLGSRVLVVDEHITGVYLDDVVDEEDLQDPLDVDGLVGEGGHHEGGHRHMPRVLGRVLPTFAVENQRLAEHALESIELEDETDPGRDLRIDLLGQRQDTVAVHRQARSAASWWAR